MQQKEEQPPKNAANKRGRPFQKGSGGRPKGSRNRVTLLVEQLVASDAEEITRVVISKAKRGNIAAALAILRTILGPAKERGLALAFKLPPLGTPADAVTAIAEIARGVAAGEIDTENAKMLISLVSEFRATIAVVDQEKRLVAVEAALRT